MTTQKEQTLLQQAEINKVTKTCSTIYYSVEVTVNNKLFILSVTVERDSRGDSLSDYRTASDSPNNSDDWNRLSNEEKEAIRNELEKYFQE